jgi:hypothetical protein
VGEGRQGRPRRRQAAPARRGAGRLREFTIEALLQNIITNDWGRKRGTGASIIHAKKFVAFVGPALSPKDALTQVDVDEFFADIIETRQPSRLHRQPLLLRRRQALEEGVSLGLIDRKPELPFEKEGEARLRWFTEDEEAMIVRDAPLLGQGSPRRLVHRPRRHRGSHLDRTRPPQVARRERLAAHGDVLGHEERRQPLRPAHRPRLGGDPAPAPSARTARSPASTRPTPSASSAASASSSRSLRTPCGTPPGTPSPPGSCSAASRSTRSRSSWATAPSR